LGTTLFVGHKLWTEQAARQLNQAHDYIALSNSESVAAQITMQIVASV
jgi:hypothetical protein